MQQCKNKRQLIALIKDNNYMYYTGVQIVIYHIYNTYIYSLCTFTYHCAVFISFIYIQICKSKYKQYVLSNALIYIFNPKQM